MCRKHFEIPLRGGKWRAKIYRGILLNPGACQIIHLSSVAQLTPLSLFFPTQIAPTSTQHQSGLGRSFPLSGGWVRLVGLLHFSILMWRYLVRSLSHRNKGVAVSYLIPPSRYSTSPLTYGSKSCTVACPFVCLPPNKYSSQENVISGWGSTGPVQITTDNVDDFSQKSPKMSKMKCLFLSSGHDESSPMSLDKKKCYDSVAGPNLGAAEATLVLSLCFTCSAMILSSFTHQSSLCDSGVRLAYASFVPQQETCGWSTLWQIRRQCSLHVNCGPHGAQRKDWQTKFMLILAFPLVNQNF